MSSAAEKAVASGRPSNSSSQTSLGADAKDQFQVDFDGEHDPANPLNWSSGRKWSLVALTSTMCLVVSLATVICTPAVPEILEEFKVDNKLYGTILVSIWELGEVIGPLSAGPLSELFGRSPVYHISNILFIVLSVGCALSQNISMLVVFRLLNGAACAPLVLNPSLVGDLFRQEERGSAMAITSMLPVLGPVLGPVIGTYITKAGGWRWVFWLTTIFAGACELLFIVFFRETYKVKLLEKKAARLRKDHNETRYQSVCTYESGRIKFQRHALRPAQIFIFSTPVTLLAIYQAFMYGYLYLALTTIAQVFGQAYGFGQGPLGLSFLGLGAGILVGLLLCRLTLDRFMKKMKQSGRGDRPEYRLIPMVFGGLLVPAGLFLYGWGAQEHWPWIVPIVGTSFIGFSLMTTTIPSNSYLIDVFGLYAASAIAASVILRNTVATILPLAAPPMYARLGFGWGNSVMAFIAIAFIPLPLVLMRYGEGMRRNSRYAAKSSRMQGTR